MNDAQQMIRSLLPELKQTALNAYKAQWRPLDLGSNDPGPEEAGKIFARIDAVVAAWLEDLPDPNEIQKLVDSVGMATVALSDRPGAANGSAHAGGNIAGFLKNIEDGLVKMSGKTVEAYKSKFLSQLRVVIANHAAMTYPVGGALAAESELWSHAPWDVARAVNRALAGMKQAVGGSGVDWKLVLEVVGQAVAGAAIFAGPLGKPVLEVSGVGVNILKAGVNAESGTVLRGQPDTYESVMTAFEESVEQINRVLTAEERELHKNIKDNMRGMDMHRRGNYDLTNDDPKTRHVIEPGPRPDLGIRDAQGGGIVIIDHHIVNGIIDEHMPAVEARLADAADALNGGYETGQLDRPAGLGYGSGVWVNSLILELVRSVKDLEWEVDQGATQLRLAIDDLNEADRSTQEALDAHRKKFERGSGHEPTYPR